MISAILLAAGESRRMGEFKQLLPLQGKTFVECCVDNLLATGVDEVIVRSERPLLVVPVYDGRRGHPIILSAQLRQELLAIDPAQGLRQVVQAYKDHTLFVEMTSDAILLDFDYPEDYQRFLAQEG
jgi:CTP:molybdopterin cytidylyltransferase MocA